MGGQGAGKTDVPHQPVMSGVGDADGCGGGALSVQDPGQLASSHGEDAQERKERQPDQDIRARLPRRLQGHARGAAIAVCTAP